MTIYQDLRYVIFTTRYATRIPGGGRLDDDMKGQVVLINSEPQDVKGLAYVGKLPVEVWIPKIVVRDLHDPNLLYQVVFDPQFVVPHGELSDPVVDAVTLRRNVYDPISRT